MEFLKKHRKFDFLYGSRSIWENDLISQVTENQNEFISVYTIDDALKVTNVAKKHEKFGAYEWVTHFENISDRPTAIISDLWDAMYSFPVINDCHVKRQTYIPDREMEIILHAPVGSNLSVKEFYVNTDHLERQFPSRYHLEKRKTYEYTASGGRSSDERAPFFHLRQGDRGVIFAIGWTGQWRCSLTRNEDEVSFRTKLEDTNFRLLPGERIRTSSVLIMPYEGKSIDAQNRWRRLIKEEFSLIGQEGRPAYAPFSMQIWGGMSSELMKKRAEIMRKNNVPVEYYWVDAGWYGMYTEKCIDEFEGRWASYTGDWRVNPYVHPNGMKDVVETVEALGMKFLLWVEPERVMHNTPIACEHPEYFLGPLSERDGNRLLDLGNPKAWQYCYDMLSSLIEELHVSCYRQDFNIEPLSLWRHHDAADRRGITEIKHIMGLYRLWDALLERFPNLVIDNCASGGKRIDIETLRRSVPLWRSDRMCQANYPEMITQVQNMTFGTWFPYSGTSAGRHFDPYRIRSAYAAGMALNYPYAEYTSFGEDEEEIENIRKFSEEYLRIRPFFGEDMYPLTIPSDATDVWSAVQFDRPSERDGVLQVFRRENSSYEKASFALGGVHKEDTYTFEDADTGECFTVSGETLLDKGVSIEIGEKRCAKIFFYKH